MERFFDVIFSALALIFLSPLLLSVAFILKFTGEGEVLFLQKRIGRHGKFFKLIKFVTMVKNSPNVGTGSLTMRDDPRILPVGTVLRKTKINELPQLLNIFFGDMSVIGPRPLTIQTFGSYSDSTQEVIKQVKPGLSGIGSIIFRGEEEILYGPLASLDFYENVVAPYKGSLEEWFVLNRGLYIYFLAIFMTVWAIFFPTTKMPWKIFKDLPKPPPELKKSLNYPTQLDVRY